VLDSVFRRHWGRVVASLVGYLGDFELDNLDAAIELAGRIPAARLGGSVEVRPLVYG